MTSRQPDLGGDDPHPLLGWFLAAAEGRFPPADGRVTVLPPLLPGGLECSVAFTGHAVVATGLDPEQVAAGGADGYGGSLDPRFLLRLAGPDGWIGVTDATLTAPATGGPPRLGTLPGLDGHPRVRFARDLRADVTVHGDERGLVTLSRGLAGRHELGVELHDTRPEGRGRGRSLLHDARTLLPAGTPLFAAVAPGNARSLRAFLAAGFTPIGSEVLLRPGRGGPQAGGPL